MYREVMRLSARYSYWGYRKIYDLIDRDQFPVGRERVRLIRASGRLAGGEKDQEKEGIGSLDAVGASS